jgi:RNA ligase (TIGR02306 family)
MSKLIVEICKIDKVVVHPNADRLDIVTIKGWECIVSKNQYKENDLVIYCPPDSVIPPDIIEKHGLEFLKKNGKVGIIKLRQIVSQGLVLDISDLPSNIKPKIGMDVAEILHITKWEPPQNNNLCLRGQKKRARKKLNPYFDKYTDIENIRHFPNLFKDGEEVIITEKIHGTNARYGMLPRYKGNILGRILSKLFGSHEFVYGSHNVQISFHKNRHCFYGEDVYAKPIKKLNLHKILPKDYIFYGEIYGKGIQDLTYGQEDIGIRFFDIKSLKSGQYLDYDEFLYITTCYGLKIAETLYRGPYSKEIVEKYTRGGSSMCENQIKEGIVIRPIKERIEHMGRVILKSISEDYLLRKNGTEYK